MCWSEQIKNMYLTVWKNFLHVRKSKVKSRRKSRVWRLTTTVPLKGCTWRKQSPKVAPSVDSHGMDYWEETLGQTRQVWRQNTSRVWWYLRKSFNPTGTPKGEGKTVNALCMIIRNKYKKMYVERKTRHPLGCLRQRPFGRELFNIFYWWLLAQNCTEAPSCCTLMGWCIGCTVATFSSLQEGWGLLFERVWFSLQPSFSYCLQASQFFNKDVFCSLFALMQ